METIAAFVTACLYKAGEKFSEKAVETAFDSRQGLADKVTNFFKPEIIQLNLSESATPEEIATQIEAKPDVVEQAAARLKGDADLFKALLEVLRETAGSARTTNIGTLKGNYIEKNKGNIHQKIS